jgi:ribosomal protein L37AE/L43A
MSHTPYTRTEEFCPKCGARMIREFDHWYCLYCGHETPEGEPKPPYGMAGWPKELNPRHEKHTHPPEGE